MAYSFNLPLLTHQNGNLLIKMVTYSSQNIENYSNMAYLSKFLLQILLTPIYFCLSKWRLIHLEKIEKYSNMAYLANFLLQILLTPHNDDILSLKMFPK